MSVFYTDMPYRVEIVTTLQNISKTTSVFDSIASIHDYLITAVEIWNGHWEGWSESDAAPAAPSMATLSMIGTLPAVILNLHYTDGFSVSVTATKSV